MIWIKRWNPALLREEIKLWQQSTFSQLCLLLTQGVRFPEDNKQTRVSRSLAISIRKSLNIANKTFCFARWVSNIESKRFSPPPFPICLSTALNMLPFQETRDCEEWCNGRCYRKTGIFTESRKHSFQRLSINQQGTNGLWRHQEPGPASLFKRLEGQQLFRATLL